MSQVREPLSLSERAQERWSHALEHAAMIGTFDPIALVGQPDTSVAREVLTALGNQCVEVITAALPRWQLSPDARYRVLSDLKADGRLHSVALSIEAEATDSFGRYLVDAVLGRLHVPDS